MLGLSWYFTRFLHRLTQAKMNVGVFPESASEFEALKAAVDRLTLNDGSIAVSRENSAALGAGFRCGSASPACFPHNLVNSMKPYLSKKVSSTC